VILARMHVGMSNAFASITISKHKVCEDVAFILTNADPGAGFCSTVRRKDTFFCLTQDRFPPLELEKRRNVFLHSTNFFNGSDATKSIGRHVIQKKDDMKEAEQPEGSRSALQQAHAQQTCSSAQAHLDVPSKWPTHAACRAIWSRQLD
jgi:hypothetical protein